MCIYIHTICMYTKMYIYYAYTHIIAGFHICTPHICSMVLFSSWPSRPLHLCFACTACTTSSSAALRLAISPSHSALSSCAEFSRAASCSSSSILCSCQAILPALLSTLLSRLCPCCPPCFGLACRGGCGGGLHPLPPGPKKAITTTATTTTTTTVIVVIVEITHMKAPPPKQVRAYNSRHHTGNND